MKVKSRIVAVLSTAMVAAASVVSFSGSAANNVVYNDPTGDGKIDMSDAVLIMQYLSGAIIPENVDKLDFDNNGVVTPMDSYKVQAYKLELLEKESNPGVYGQEAETFFENETPRSYRVYNAKTRSLMRKYSLAKPPVYSNEDSGISTYSMTDGIDDRYIDWSKSGTVKLMSSKDYKGTGFVVAPHVVATCAHCVYDIGTDSLCNISTIKLFNNNGEVSLNATPREIHIPTKYYVSSEYDAYYDYALITVEEDLSDYMCYDLGVALDSVVTESDKRENLPVYVTGFPMVSNRYHNVGIDNMLTGVGKFLYRDDISNYFTSHQLVYDTYVSLGDSGSPVYIKETYSDKHGNDAEYYTVVGISSSGSTNFSVCTRITTDLLVFFKQNPNLKWE